VGCRFPGSRESQTFSIPKFPGMNVMQFLLTGIAEACIKKCCTEMLLGKQHVDQSWTRGCRLQRLNNCYRVRHTHTHTQPFYGCLDFVRDNPDELVPEETFTHSHLSWSSIIPYLLPPSITIHGILSVQFTCLTVYLLAWHPILHTPYISLPNHCLLFAAHAHTIATWLAVLPRLCHLILV